MPSYQRKIAVPGKTAEQIYGVVDQHLEGLLSKFSVGKIGVKKDPSSRKIGIESPMFSATLSCLEGAVELDGKLSLMATPFKSKIDEGIDRFLSKYLKG
jgi:hypothetical protein